MIEQLAEMPTYGAYKDSGVEWLGEIPAHWQQNRFKFVGSASKGKLPKRIVSIESADLPAYMTMDYLRGGQANQWVLDSNLEVIEYDEVLLLWDGSNSGEFLKSKKGVISSTVALIKFRGVLKQFGWYFSSVIERRLRTSTVGMGIPHVNGQELINCELLIPTVPEQLAIAAYLDNKTAQIDQAVAIKEQQIALLKEHKQILIQTAVTRGLDPNVPMRDSGVEWIGEIPAHWEIKKIKYVAGDFMYGTSVDCNELEVGTPVLRIPNIGELDISFVDLKYTSLTEVETKKYLLRKHDILIVRTNGNPELVGKSAIFDGNGEYMFASYLIRVKPKSNIEPRFLIHAMNSFSIRGALTYSSRTSAGNYNLNTQSLGDCYIAYSAKEEQISIVAHIEIESAKIELAIALQQQQIDKLKEYKATLINSAVTGKIKVIELGECKDVG